MLKINKTLNWNGNLLEIGTEEIAHSTDGSVIVKMGDSIVLCTCVAARTVSTEQNFFPLTVNYREMAFAAGKIPGGFIKREGKNSEREVLVSRLIDRSMRPLFSEYFLNETQIICTVLSYDPKYNTDILALIGASIAVNIAGLPFEETIAAARVGRINDNFVLNPSAEELKNSSLDLIISATKQSLVMVEAEAGLFTNNQMLDAMKFAHANILPVIDFINEIVADFGKPKWKVSEISLENLKQEIYNKYNIELSQIIKILDKKQRKLLLSEISEKISSEYTDSTEYSKTQIEQAVQELESKLMRDNVLQNQRIDGRKFNEIRPISGNASLLPRTHGSALFTRGETQALVVTTLGTNQDEQLVESLDGEYRERFMLNYIFSPYSVGEVGQLKSPSRREIGHGKLAWKAFNKILPTKSEFPYSIRVVSEITSCNGSSSMATISGTSMSLMDAGVNIKTPIAGIAMGLVKEGQKHVILSDIMSFEDAFGDMDFKVAGSKDAITALQMDIKIKGLSFDLLNDILLQAQEGREFILSEMEKIITNSKSEVSSFAPSMHSMKIEKEKIRDVIGAGGKIIKEISETNSAKIDISDDGTIAIAAPNKEKLDAVINKINSIVRDPQLGDLYEGTVVKVLDSLAFVNYYQNKEGVLHISEIAQGREVDSLTKLLKQNDHVKVKIIGFDMKGKAKLTAKLETAPINTIAVTDEKKEKPKTKKTKPQNSNQVAKENSNNINRSGARKWNKQPNSPQADEVKTERKYFS